MVAARRIIALSVDTDERQALVEVARSRTEPANRVERAGIVLAYLDEPSAYAVARAMRVSQQTVTPPGRQRALRRYRAVLRGRPSRALRRRRAARPSARRMGTVDQGRRLMRRNPTGLFADGRQHPAAVRSGLRLFV